MTFSMKPIILFIYILLERNISITFDGVIIDLNLSLSPDMFM